jgi:hypothetical protein
VKRGTGLFIREIKAESTFGGGEKALGPKVKWRWVEKKISK